MTRTWRLDTPRQTLVLASKRSEMPEVIYWGAALPYDEALDGLVASHEVDFTGGMLDSLPAVSLCPEAARSFEGQAGLSIRDKSGHVVFPQFHFIDAKLVDNSLVIFCENERGDLRYEAHFKPYENSNIISAYAKLVSDVPIYVDWFAAPVLPAPQMTTEIMDFSGRWCGEFQSDRRSWQAGIHMRDNRTGRTGHEHFPGLFLLENGATNTKGHVFGFHYGWSGGHKMVCEELADGRRQVQFGHAFATQMEAATSFSTAPLYLTCSANGLNDAARSFQRHVRKNIVSSHRAKRPRPVHYNCWESVYFQHDIGVLKEIATRAAALGAERFVLDDGWFGARNDDTSSLGDWFVDKTKYPDGLAPLISHVHQEGMSFGIWFEPEMVNVNSELFVQHPEWVLGPANQVLGRNQMVLNLALPEVRAYLFNSVSEILETYEIDYIKWDHNRVLPIADAEQTYGTYALLDELAEAFPKVEIESCASGGGRIDFGILSRTQRVWLSDSNDALERARIQHGAALFLPASITGSHVGPRHCHTSRRVHDISYRAWIAAQRHMGFEMDPRELTADEVKVLKNVTAWWKSQREWLMNADILRLDSNDPAVIAEAHLSEDESQFVVFVNKIDSSRQISPRPVRLDGLKPDAIYQVELVNREESHALSRGLPAVKQGIARLSGSYLMNHGINLPWSFPGQVWVIKGQKT